MIRFVVKNQKNYDEIEIGERKKGYQLGCKNNVLICKKYTVFGVFKIIIKVICAKCIPLSKSIFFEII
jgi:hypothetical protein